MVNNEYSYPYMGEDINHGSYENIRDYQNSRQLDVHRWSDYCEVNEFVDKIYLRYFKGYQGREDIAKKHVKVLLLDLYVAWGTDPDMCLSVSKSKRGYLAGTRYNELHISSKMISVIDIMAVEGLIEQKIGFHDPNGRGFNTRIWPTEKLIRMFERARFGVLDIVIHPDRETILLKAERVGKEKPKLMEYEDTTETKAMRELLRRYNDFLATCFIDIPELDRPLVELEKGRVHIGQHRKFVYRVFNDGRWDHGGRFYGGFWQNLPEEWRAKIRVNGLMMREIDYSAFHPVLLYARRGIDYWTKIGKDPYDVLTDDLKAIGLDRAFVKSVFLIVINAKARRAACNAIRDEMNGRKRKTKGRTGRTVQATNDKTRKYAGVEFTDSLLNRVIDLIELAHPDIEGGICANAGIELMNLDARVTEEIVRHFLDQEVPVLSVHDSYLVPFGYEGELHRTMVNAYAKVTGVQKVKMKRDGVSQEEWNSWRHLDRNLYLAYADHLAIRNPSRGYLARKAAFERWLNSNAQDRG